MSASAPTGNANRPVQLPAADASKSESTSTKKPGNLRKLYFSKSNQRPQVNSTTVSPRAPSNGGLDRQGSVGNLAPQPSARRPADGDMKSDSTVPASSPSGAGQLELSAEAREAISDLNQITNVDQRKCFFSFKAKTKPPQKFNDNEKKQLDALLQELRGRGVEEQLTQDQKDLLSSIEGNKNATGKVGRTLWKNGVRNLLKSLASNLSSPVAPSGSQGAPQPERAVQDLGDDESDDSGAETPHAHNDQGAPPAGDQQDEQPALPPKFQQGGLSTVLEVDDEDGEEIPDNISQSSNSSNDYAETGIDQDELAPAPENAEDRAQALEGSEKLKAVSFSKSAPPKKAETKKSAGASSDDDTKEVVGQSNPNEKARYIKFNTNSAAQPASPKENAEGAMEAKGEEAGDVNPAQPQGRAEEAKEEFQFDQDAEKFIELFGIEDALEHPAYEEYAKSRVAFMNSQKGGAADEQDGVAAEAAAPAAPQPVNGPGGVLTAAQLREQQAQAAAAAAQQAEKPADAEGEANNDVAPAGQEESAPAAPLSFGVTVPDASDDEIDDVVQSQGRGVPVGGDDLQEGAPVAPVQSQERDAPAVVPQAGSDDTVEGAQSQERGVPVAVVPEIAVQGAEEEKAPVESADPQEVAANELEDEATKAKRDRMQKIMGKFKESVRNHRQNRLENIANAVMFAGNPNTTLEIMDLTPESVLPGKNVDATKAQVESLVEEIRQFNEQKQNSALTPDEANEKVEQLTRLVYGSAELTQPSGSSTQNTGNLKGQIKTVDEAWDKNAGLQWKMGFADKREVKKYTAKDFASATAGDREEAIRTFEKQTRIDTNLMLGQANRIGLTDLRKELIETKKLAESVIVDFAKGRLDSQFEALTNDMSTMETEVNALNLADRASLDQANQIIARHETSRDQVVEEARDTFSRLNEDANDTERAVVGEYRNKLSELASSFNSLVASLRKNITDGLERFGQLFAARIQEAKTERTRLIDKEDTIKDNIRDGKSGKNDGLAGYNLQSLQQSRVRLERVRDAAVDRQPIVASLPKPSIRGEQPITTRDTFGVLDQANWDDFFSQAETVVSSLEEQVQQQSAASRSMLSFVNDFSQDLAKENMTLSDAQKDELSEAYGLAGDNRVAIEETRADVEERRALLEEMKGIYNGPITDNP